MSLGKALSRALAFARTPAVLGMANVFVLKGATVILSFALITLAARGLGEHDFGTFSILFSAAGLFSIFVAMGQQVLLMRSWNEYAATGDVPHLKGMLIYGVAAFAAGAGVLGCGFFVVLCLFYPISLAASATLYMVTLGLVLTSAHLVRTAIGVGVGDGFGNILGVAFPIVYLLVCLVWGTKVEVQTVLLMLSLGAGVAIGIHVVVMARKIHAMFPQFIAVRPRFEFHLWTARSVKLWISNGLEASNQYLDVLIIGLMMSPSIAGAYFVTTRLANAFATASDAMHMFSTRYIPDLYYRGELGPLNNLLNSVAAITLAVIVCGMVVVLGGGHWLLLAFSGAYVSYYPALALLCVGTAAVAAVGPSGSILMFTGHEGTYLKIIAATVTLRAIGFFVLVPQFAVVGAVAATAISFLFMAIMLRNSAKRLTGMDGSVVRLLPAMLDRARQLVAK